MKEVYSAQEFFPGVFHITAPGNVWPTLIVGKEKALLYDTGFGVGDLKGFVKSITDLPLYVLNSHSHLDHTLGDFQFDQVYINEQEIPSTVDPSMQRASRERAVATTEAALGFLPEGFDVEAFYQASWPEFLPLNGGEVFDLGGLEIEAILTPGHTPGSISLLDRDNGLLFTGDWLSPHVWMFMPNSITLAEYDKVLDHVDQLPFQHVLCAHRGFVLDRGVLQRMKQSIADAKPENSKPYDHPLAKQRGAMIYTLGDPTDRAHVIELVYVP